MQFQEKAEKKRKEKVQVGFISPLCLCRRTAYHLYKPYWAPDELTIGKAD